MTNRKLAAAGLATALVVGATAGALAFTPVGAMAVESAVAASAPVGWVGEALRKLVDDGTITKEQSDAVIGALEEARPAHKARRGVAHASLDAAARALGIGVGELREQLRTGRTIAAVAAERDVEVQSVIDAMVADFKAHLDRHVASGDITREQADARGAAAVRRFTALVNGEVVFEHRRGPRGQRGEGRSFQPPGAPANSAAPSVAPA